MWVEILFWNGLYGDEIFMEKKIDGIEGLDVDGWMWPSDFYVTSHSNAVYEELQGDCKVIIEVLDSIERRQLKAHGLKCVETPRVSWAYSGNSRNIFYSTRGNRRKAVRLQSYGTAVSYVVLTAFQDGHYECARKAANEWISLLCDPNMYEKNSETGSKIFFPYLTNEKPSVFRSFELSIVTKWGTRCRSFRPLTKMSTRNISWGVKTVGA